MPVDDNDYIDFKPTEKPHKGTLHYWKKMPCKSGLGFYIAVGYFDQHPDFHGMTGHTSYVEKIDETTGEIETRNSRYTLGKPVSEWIKEVQAARDNQPGEGKVDEPSRS